MTYKYAFNNLLRMEMSYNNYTSVISLLSNMISHEYFFFIKNSSYLNLYVLYQWVKICKKYWIINKIIFLIWYENERGCWNWILMYK